METVKNEEFNHGQAAVIKRVKIDTLDQKISGVFSFNFPFFFLFPFKVLYAAFIKLHFFIYLQNLQLLIVNDKVSKSAQTVKLLISLGQSLPSKFIIQIFTLLL